MAEPLMEKYAGIVEYANNDDIEEAFHDFIVNGTRIMPEEITPKTEIMAIISILIMSILPIIIGSIRSVKLQTVRKATGIKNSIAFTKKVALIFPILASMALLGLYITFKIFSTEQMQLSLIGYFVTLGVITLSNVLDPVVNYLIPKFVPKIAYHMLLIREEGATEKACIDYKFTTHKIISLLLCSGIGIWYVWKKNWIANNIFGLAFSIHCVEIFHLNTFLTGCILLIGLLFYDIFFVFGTDVMITVVKSFDAPNKVVFPKDLIANGMLANKFTMLGLGDIVMPGILIALLLRYDLSKAGKRSIYFSSTLFAYFLGMLATIAVMHIYNHAQPALLYLVPACMGTPLLIAFFRGELRSLLSYQDYPEEIEDPSKKSN